MATQSHVLVLAGEYDDLLSAMHDLNVHSKTRPQLRSFLAKASSTVRELTAGLNRTERAALGGGFEDLIELTERHISQGQKSIVLEFVIVTAIQAARLLLLTEDHPSIFSVNADHALWPIGSGAGLLCASIVAKAWNAADVLTLGVEAVATAFRLALDLQHSAEDTGITETVIDAIALKDSIRAVSQELPTGVEVAVSVWGSTISAWEVQAIISESHQSVRITTDLPVPKPWGDSIDSIPEDAIAVVGMSGRFPQSDTLDELWQLLEAGQTTHQEIPADRFDLNDFYDPSRGKHNALFSKHGCFIRRPGDFDNRLFNISPKEALQMDPVQRMLLMTTYESLEMAGYAPNGDATPPRIATYFGQTVDDWKTIQEQQGIDTHFLPAVNRGFAPGRLNHYFKWAGGFYSIDTGCSSSATGICLAREALAHGECDAAVVGGGTLLTAPEWFAGLGQGGFLSQTGACKTYSEDADGYCRGEGVAVVVLKRLADAIKSKDNVLAVIAGASRNCNAGSGSITHPGQHAQEALYRRTLRQAAVQPKDVNVIEMHGTGTQAGDKVETTAVRNVFASKKREHPFIIGAIKAAIGHSEAAAGVVSLMKAILILKKDSIPPQPNQPISLNPHLVPLLGSDIQLANGQSWPRTGKDPRYVFVNNFDAAGGNVSMLIHDAPAYAQIADPVLDDAKTSHIVVTSGRTPAAHEANKSRLRKHLIANPKTHLASLAYTTTARRMHQVDRQAYVVTTMSDLVSQLEKPLPKSSTPASSVVFAFTGQGSQYLGMGSKLYHSSSTFRHLLDSYQRLCDSRGLTCNFLDAIRGTDDAEQCATDREMQVATVALEIALARYWQSLGFQPSLVIGHSLGEYAGLCIAGVLSVCDALTLACARATLIAERCSASETGMLAVGLPLATVQWRIRDLAATTSSCEVCCVNGPSSTVVGGPEAAIAALEAYLKSDGVAATRLRTKHAFHTRHMDPVLEDLEKRASQVTFHAPSLPVASTLLGRVVQIGEEGVFGAEYLRRHTREPVAFVDAVRACESAGLVQSQSFVIEIGPHPVCIGLLASSLTTAKPSSFASLRRGQDDLLVLSQCIAAAHRAQLPVDWVEFHKDHMDQVSMISDLPTYAFEMKSFWLTYKKSSNKTPALTESPVSTHLASTTLHNVEQLRKEGSKLYATFTADTSEKYLAKAIGGHVVDGVAICPASIFMDMGYTAATYLEAQSHGVQEVSLTTLELTNLVMQSPLVLREGMSDWPQLIVEAVLDKLTMVVTVTFLSSKATATNKVTHGSCVFRLGLSETSSTQTWSRMKPLVDARVRTLEGLSRPREVHCFDRNLFYKYFSEIVDYSPQYHAVEEATISADFKDATIILQSLPASELGSFISNPFAVDAIVHVAGFLLNADVRKPKGEVHIANHIGSLRILGDLSFARPCRAYATVREQNLQTGSSLCDVYVTDEHSKLIAVCSDIQFQKLDRDFFAMLTGSNRAVGPTNPAPAAPRQSRQRQIRTPASSAPSTPRSLSSSAASSVSDMVDLAEDLLKAVAERSGLSLSEIESASGTTFADMGVDSQMSIAILSDFQKATAVELPAAFFTNFPTPAAVVKELGVPIQNGSPVVERQAKPRSRNHSRSKRTSPRAEQPSTQLLHLVADALGLEHEVLTPATTFESVGMDSMLSIKVISQFQQISGLELPAAFFSEHTTVKAVQQELDVPDVQRDSADPPNSTTASTIDTTEIKSPRQEKLDRAVSRAVLIQGQSRSKAAPLFMTTDGSGTVESYIHLKALAEGRRIYALESPFLQDPEHFDLSIQEMATIFIRTIRRIQPQGPYLIGGWSAGSIYAYEVAHRLATQGEVIQGLIILDMRAPSLIPTDIVTTDFVNKLGTFEGINRARDLPEDLSVKEREHLMATCRALSQYDAPHFPANNKPRQSTVVWARLGLDNRPDAPKAAMRRPEVDMGKDLHQISLDEYERYFNSWFYGRREDFGTNGWEDYLGENITVFDVDGDHFSMMTPPFAAEVGKIVTEAVSKAVS